MVGFDGTFYQLRSDGSAHPVTADHKTPFAVVTFFRAEQDLNVARQMTKSDLLEILEKATNANLFSAVRVNGLFDEVRTRTVQRQSRPFLPSPKQPNIKRRKSSPTCMGPWPDFVRPHMLRASASLVFTFTSYGRINRLEDTHWTTGFAPVGCRFAQCMISTSSGLSRQNSSRRISKIVRERENHGGRGITGRNPLSPLFSGDSDTNLGVNVMPQHPNHFRHEMLRKSARKDARKPTTFGRRWRSA